MTRKLDKEHLEEIQTLQKEFDETAKQLGNLSIEKDILNKKIEFIDNEVEQLMQTFYNLQARETELIEKMRIRYGEGQINVADGTFTPDSGLAK
jgi:predicted nuclease with TOPRIM domain